jgi:hypothetical protein
MSEVPDYSDSPLVFQALALHRTSLILTPNLITLHFCFKDITFAKLFFSDSLKEVTFYRGRSSLGDIESTVQQLPFSGMRSLAIENIPVDLASFMKSQFLCLKTLTVHSLSDRSAFGTLLALLSLVSFDVTLSPTYSSAPGADVDASCSDALHTLFLEGKAEHLVSILRILPAANEIEQIRLVLPRQEWSMIPHVDHFERLFQLVTRLRLPHMRSLTLHSDISGSPSTPQGSITHNTLLPLSTNPNLQTLDLHLPLPIIFSESDIRALTSAWPNIREFKLLPHRHVSSSSSTASMELLQYFTTSFRSLQTLGMRVTTGAIPENIPLQSFSESITIFDVGESPLSKDSVERSARHIATLFPNLKNFIHPNTEEWRTVDSFLAFATTIRESERLRIKGLEGA